MELDFISVFFAGFASFITPCVLPMIPVYLMYLTGAMDVESIQEDWKKTLSRSLAFVLGFTIVFVLMGLTATAFGRLLFRNREIMRKVGSILIIFFGLAMLGVIRLPQFGEGRRMKDASGFISSVLMGMAFSIGWSPCLGPVLGAVLAYASNQQTMLRGALLLLAYSVGLAVPFVLSGFFAGKIMNWINKFSNVIKFIPKIAGVLLIIFGGLMFFDKLAFLSNL